MVAHLFPRKKRQTHPEKCSDEIFVNEFHVNSPVHVRKCMSNRTNIDYFDKNLDYKQMYFGVLILFIHLYYRLFVEHSALNIDCAFCAEAIQP